MNIPECIFDYDEDPEDMRCWPCTQSFSPYSMDPCNASELEREQKKHKLKLLTKHREEERKQRLEQDVEKLLQGEYKYKTVSLELAKLVIKKLKTRIQETEDERVSICGVFGEQTARLKEVKKDLERTKQLSSFHYQEAADNAKIIAELKSELKATQEKLNEKQACELCKEKESE